MAWRNVRSAIPRVAASEKGKAQTSLYVKARARCTTGVVGQHRANARISRGVTNLHSSLISLERITGEGNSPVDERM